MSRAGVHGLRFVPRHRVPPATSCFRGHPMLGAQGLAGASSWLDWAGDTCGPYTQPPPRFLCVAVTSPSPSCLLMKSDITQLPSPQRAARTHRPPASEGQRQPNTPAPVPGKIELGTEWWGRLAHPWWTWYISLSVLQGVGGLVSMSAFPRIWVKEARLLWPILECDYSLYLFFIMDLKEYLFDCLVLVEAHRLFLASRGAFRSGAQSLVVTWAL